MRRRRPLPPISAPCLMILHTKRWMEVNITFLKIHLLLYADDTIILVESEADLQAALHAVSHYCNIWKLEIKTKKTKVMVFSRGKIRKVRKFVYNNITLAVVPNFRYLVSQWDSPSAADPRAKNTGQRATKGTVLTSQSLSPWCDCRRLGSTLGSWRWQDINVGNPL